jgi:hypothetical protein
LRNEPLIDNIEAFVHSLELVEYQATKPLNIRLLDHMAPS